MSICWCMISSICIWPLYHDNCAISNSTGCFTLLLMGRMVVRAYSGSYIQKTVRFFVLSLLLTIFPILVNRCGWSLNTSARAGNSCPFVPWQAMRSGCYRGAEPWYLFSDRNWSPDVIGASVLSRTIPSPQSRWNREKGKRAGIDIKQGRGENQQFMKRYRSGFC